MRAAHTARMGTSGAEFPLQHAGEITAWQNTFFPRPYPFKIGLRQDAHAELTGLEMFEDGISFRSSQPLPLGRIVEIVMAGGHMSLEATIDDCMPNHDEFGGWILRARFTADPARCKEIASMLSADIRDASSQAKSRHQPPSPSAA